MDGTRSNAGGFRYKLDEINIADNWNPKEAEPEKMGGFNFGTEDKILRQLHRGNTIYDVIVPEDAEIVLCDEEKYLQTLIWKNRVEISKYIIIDRVNKENVDEFINEFENYTKKSEKFNYYELGKESKIIYDMLKKIKL